MARWLLRVAVAASMLLIAAHFAYTVSTFHTLTLASVQFAELGLPLLFAALLNAVVWSLDFAPPRARLAAHFANACMVLVAALVVRLSPVAPAYLVLLCAALLALAATLNHAAMTRSTARVGVATA